MSSSRDDFTIAIRSALLQRGARQKFSLLFLFCFSLIIFFLDIYKVTGIKTLRNIINDGVYRISNLATSPFRLLENTSVGTKKLIFIYQENIKLRKELEKLQNKDLQVEFLQNQNKNLKKTLETDASTERNSIIAKVLLDKSSPYLKSIIVNRGSSSGILKGMPVLDGSYLVGKTVEVNYLSSRVLLLNDLNSRIPVTFGADATQAILTGTGTKKPKLEYLPEQFVALEGQKVFTSGKDGIFLPGIPVGLTENNFDETVIKLYSDPNQLSFVNIEIIKNQEEVF
jgi:rod shape-determining protein MreC